MGCAISDAMYRPGATPKGFRCGPRANSWNGLFISDRGFRTPRQVFASSKLRQGLVRANVMIVMRVMGLRGSRPGVPLFPASGVAKIEREHALGRRRSAKLGQWRAVDARRDAGEHVIDRPRAIPFDAATELTVRRVRRSRPAFIFPNADRESMSIKFGFFDVGVHARDLSCNFFGLQAGTRLSPTSAFLISQL
jgi:hypothetical protein